MSCMTNEDYVKKLSSIEPNIEPLCEYIGALEKITVRCKLCGNVWSAQASNLINKIKASKCPKCHSRTSESYKKCLNNTHKEFAQYLVDPTIGERFSYGSTKKVDWICPNCHTIVEGISIAKVISRKHIPCKVCSDGVSYPNKYMLNVLSQLGIEFVTEYSPSWISPKRYYFFIPSLNLIIEMDGSIGHGKKTFDGRSPEETFEIDLFKDRLAKEHGLSVIRINCDISDSDYIKSNILESKLSTLLNLDDVDFLLCNKKAYSSLKIEICDFWNESHEMSHILKYTNMPRVTITKYLNDCAKYGLCDYDPKEQMKRSGLRNIVKTRGKNSKKVICLDTGDIFESCASAYKWLGYNVDGHSIQDNCKGKTQTAGKHPLTKEKLHWMFYDDYLCYKEVS